jgi:hypothetical protein
MLMMLFSTKYPQKQVGGIEWFTQLSADSTDDTYYGDSAAAVYDPPNS